MTQFARMFGTEKYKGTRNYINTQKKYEILRTLIYFFISLSLFAAGYLTTKTRMNLLTVVAVVGCLPACKSLVSVIMFLRYRSMPDRDADRIAAHTGNLHGLYDMIFTSYQTNFDISHLVVHGNTICGYTTDSDFKDKEFSTHIEGVLATEGYKNYTIKVFKDLSKYLDRLDQLNELEAENKNVDSILGTLKSIVL